jgi:hypothetical protein
MTYSFLQREIAPFNIYKVLWKFTLWVLRIISAIFLTFIALLLNILLIGFLADLAATPLWYLAQRETHEYFAKLKDYRYQASSLNFTVTDENAWGYYNRAAQWLHDLEGEDREVIHSYSDERKKFTFADSEHVVKRYARALAVWDSGAACRYCIIPTDYEKGLMKPIPNYIGFQKLSELALVYSNTELANGNRQKAAEVYVKVFKMGADIGGGEEELMGRMFGNEIASNVEKQLMSNINAFDLEETAYLRENLRAVERNWPRFDSALEAEGRSYLLPSNTGWDGMKLFFMMMGGGYIEPPFMLRILDRIGASLLSWNQVFSVRFTAIAASQRVVNWAKRCNAVQGKDWETIQPVLVRADSEVARDSRHWDITVIPIPNFTRMYKRTYATHVAMRVIEGGLRLRGYKLEHKQFPNNLEQFLASDTSHYDPANSKPLHSVRDSTGKVIRLYSIGLNLKDEKGEGTPTNGWTNAEKDDIWVEVK